MKFAVTATLREFYPAALAAFEDLSGGDALEVLRVAPTPELGPWSVCLKDRRRVAPWWPTTPGR